MNKAISLTSLYGWTILILGLGITSGTVMAQVVTNTNTDGEGSLQAAIDSANAHPGTTIRFNIDVQDSENDCTGSFCRITLLTPLPPINGRETVVDGLSQLPDTTWIDAGLSVGYSRTPMPPQMRPGIEIRDGADLPVGVDIRAEGVVLRGISIYGFGTDPDSLDHANVRIDLPLTNTLNLTAYVRLEHSLLGRGIETQGKPAPDDRTGGANVVAMNGMVHLRHNRIAYADGSGIRVPGSTASKGLIEYNIISHNGRRSNQPGVSINSGFDNLSVNLSHTVQYNHISDNHGAGVEKTFLFPRNSIYENDIVGNGIGSEDNGAPATAGLRLNGSNFVFQNRIFENMGAGVLILERGQSQLSLNLIYDNGNRSNLDGDGPSGQIGIDLLSANDDPGTGTPPFVTPNDPDDLDRGGNGLFNVPVLVEAFIHDDSLTVSGFSRPFSLIEFYAAKPDSSGFGEGYRFLFAGQEGVVDDFRPETVTDQDSTVGDYGMDDPNTWIGSDRTNRFRFTAPFPDSLSRDLSITATATDRGDPSVFCIEGCTYPTSEFSANVDIRQTTLTSGGSPDGNKSEYLEVFPNPFGDQTFLKFVAERSQTVRLDLYDVLGRRVDTLFEGTIRGARTHAVRVDGSKLVDGIYFARLRGPYIDSVQPLIRM